MGKLRRHNEVREGSNPVEDECRDGTVKATTGKEKRQARYGIEARRRLQKESSPAAVEAVKGRKQVNYLAKKAAAHQFKKEKSIQGELSGDSGARKNFSWSSAQEIIVLSELVKQANMDACQTSDAGNIDWEQLALTVGQRLDHNITRTQIYEKARRLKEKYRRTHQRVSQGKLSSFKNDDDDKIYKLSQQMWGNTGDLRLQLEEEEHDPLSGNLAKNLSDADDPHKHGSSSNDIKWDILKLNTEKTNMFREHEGHPSCPSERRQENGDAKGGSHEQAKPGLDLTSLSNIPTMEGDTQKTFEVFRDDHQALLKKLERSCEAVLQDMQVKFLRMMNSAVRGGNEIPWMGGGGHVPSFESIMQVPVSWDKMVDNCLAGTSTNKPAAFESLYEQWQRQRLQELKLTSMKLQLMLDECKMEQEKLEKQVCKS